VAGVLTQFLFVRLAEMGGNGTVMGISRAITCAAEVPFFHFAGALEKRLGVRGVLALACVCYAVRFLYYAWMSDPWWVMPAEVLHGVTFAAMWAARYVGLSGITSRAPLEVLTPAPAVLSCRVRKRSNAVRVEARGHPQGVMC
jgi:hypothetical protein